MPLIPWRPLWDIDRWFEEEWPEFPSLFERKMGIKIPRMDIYEDNGNVVAEVELPGVNPKDINVEVENNYLKIEAKSEEKKEEKKKGYYRKELSTGYYRRMVPLPVEVVESKADAQYEDGILKIVVPKKKIEKKEKKRVKVKIKSKKK